MDEAHLPASDWIFETIETVFEHGVRRPGYAADRWAERWIYDHLESFGLEEVRGEPVELYRWDDHATRLRIHPVDRPDAEEEIPCFALPHCTPVDGLEAELALLEDETGDVTDRLAVHELSLTRMPLSFMRERASRCYDPEDAFSSLTQVLPFGDELMFVMEPALDAGAAGYLGILSGVPWETHEYYVPYDAVERSIPGVWIGGRDGRRVKEMMASGPVRAELTVDATRTPVESYNILGRLPGNSDEWIVVGTHHDGPWASAVEDASGIALVLAQACYWSRIPRAKRPHNLLFLFNAGHMAGGAGCRAFLEEHEDELDDVVAEIHLEHAARRCRVENGELIPTEDPEVRWWFTSPHDRLEDLVAEAVRGEDLRRSLLLPPEIFGAIPTTDGGHFHLHDVPLVQHLAAPMYLFDPRDTPDKIHRDSLLPLTRATVRIMEALGDWGAGELRDGMRSGEQATIERLPGAEESRSFEFPGA